MSDVSLHAKVQFTPRDVLGRFVETRITPGVVASVKASQGLIVQEAKTIVPVDTGFLRESIAVEDVSADGKTVVGKISAGAHYAGYVEFGTGQRGAASAGRGPYPYSADWKGQPAQPYLRPALDATREAVKAIFASSLSVELQK